MKAAAVLTVLLCLFFSAEVMAGIGKPIPVDSPDAGERDALIKKVFENPVVRAAAKSAGEDGVKATLERLSDRDLKLLAQNTDKMLSGGATGLEEALLAIVIVAMVVGAIMVLLLVLGAVAIFGSGRSAPMGSAQYDEQRRKTEEMKEIGKPAQQGQ